MLRVTFDGTVEDSLPWSFVPAQRDVRIVPGESALAFYTAKNTSDAPITGVATSRFRRSPSSSCSFHHGHPRYNVQPPQAGQYFVKIQCFCFDEQRLGAGEELDAGRDAIVFTSPWLGRPSPGS